MKKQTYMPSNPNFSDTLRDAFDKLRPVTNNSISATGYVTPYATIDTFSASGITFTLEVVKVEFDFWDYINFNTDIYYLDVNSGILSSIPGYDPPFTTFFSNTMMSIVTVFLSYYTIHASLSYPQLLEIYEDYISSHPGAENIIIQTIKECVNVHKDELTFSDKETVRYIKTRGVTGKVLGKFVGKTYPASSYSDSAIPPDSHLKTYTSYSGYVDDLSHSLFTNFGYSGTEKFHEFNFKFGKNYNDVYDKGYRSTIYSIRDTTIPNKNITYLSPISGTFYPTTDDLHDLYMNPVTSNPLSTNVFNDNVVRYKDGSFPLWYCIATNKKG